MPPERHPADNFAEMGRSMLRPYNCNPMLPAAATLASGNGLFRAGPQQFAGDD